MKTIYFIRHAKAKKIADSDFIRELNNKGKEAAKLMSKRLKNRNITPDIIISSPANRTAKTAKIFAKNLKFNKDIKFEKGQELLVHFSGNVMETYPAQLGNIGKIEIIKENDFEMLMVVNRFRPETKDADLAIEIMHEMERASGMKFTGIINNSNLGTETDAACIISSVSYAEEISEKTGLPIVMTTVWEGLYNQLSDKISALFPLKLQEKYF